MIFEELFRLSIRHSFYQDGRCPDFDITPDGSTEALLRNHRAIAKITPDSLTVIEARDSAGEPRIPFSQNAEFRFLLQLERPAFLSFTDLDAIGGEASLVFGPDASLIFGPETEGSELEVGPGLGADSATGAFALVRVRPGEATTDRFEVSFEPKKFTWRYYCLTNLAGRRRPRLVDRGDGPRVTFDVLDWSASCDVVDPLAAGLAERFPDQRILRYESNQPVPSRQRPAARLELRLAGEPLLGPLPLPRPTAQAVGPADAAPFLFQTLRYSQQPLSIQENRDLCPPTRRQESTSKSSQPSRHPSPPSPPRSPRSSGTPRRGRR